MIDVNISPTPFLSSLTGKIYKLIPLREDQDSGKVVYLEQYVDSLLIELIGAMETYDVLKNDKQYISVINTVQYMKHNSMKTSVWRRETFKMLRCIDKIQYALGGGDSG